MLLSTEPIRNPFWMLTYNVRHFRVAAVRFGVRVGTPKAALPYFPEVDHAQE